jgi:hypothetical protein
VKGSKEKEAKVCVFNRIVTATGSMSRGIPRFDILECHHRTESGGDYSGKAKSLGLWKILGLSIIYSAELAELTSVRS